MSVLLIFLLIFSTFDNGVHGNAIPSKADAVRSPSRHESWLLPRDDIGGVFAESSTPSSKPGISDATLASQVVLPSPTLSSSYAGLGGNKIAVARVTTINPILAAPAACQSAPAATVYVAQTQLRAQRKRDVEAITQTIWQTQTVVETETITTTSYATETYFATTVSVTVQSAYVAYSVPTTSPSPQDNTTSCSSSPGEIINAQGCSMDVEQRNVVANYDSLPVSNHTFNFFDYSPYLGLNYSAFNIANNPIQADSASPPNYIISQSNLTGARRISVQAPFVAFSLLSFAFACSQSIPQVACNVRMQGIKAPTTIASGAAAGGFVVSDLLYAPNATYNAGFRMIKTHMDELKWSNLTQATFAAQIGGNEVDLLIDELEYALSGKKDELKSVLG